MRPVLTTSLCLLGLAGCWPWIDEPFSPPGRGPEQPDIVDDTDVDTDPDTDVDTDTDPDTDVDTDPDTDPVDDDGVRLTGLLEQRDYYGTYWSDTPVPRSYALLGWEAEDATGVDLTRVMLGDSGRCIATPGLADWQAGLDSTAPEDEISLRSARTVRVPIDDRAGLWLTPDWDEGESFPVERPVALTGGRADGKRLSATELMVMPPTLSFSGPQLDGSSLELVAPSSLVWTWGARPTGVDHVMLDVLLTDDAGAVIEQVTCIEPVSSGRIRATTSSFTALDRAVLGYVTLSTVTRHRATVAPGTQAEVLAITSRMGVVQLP